MNRLKQKGRPSSRFRGPKGTSLVTASAGYGRSLAHRCVYPKGICQRRKIRNQQMSETLTLCGSASESLLDGWDKDTKDGYSEKAIAEQSSITGLDITARYTRTFIEWCMRN